MRAFNRLQISIHKALTGLDSIHTSVARGQHISIHKALTGLDYAAIYGDLHGDISIHKALTGLDVARYFSLFLLIYFNPQGPHGPRRERSYDEMAMRYISIHKALTGLDLWSDWGKFAGVTFQSTRPSRASTTNRSPAIR